MFPHLHSCRTCQLSLYNSSFCQPNFLMVDIGVEKFMTGMFSSCNMPRACSSEYSLSQICQKKSSFSRSYIRRASFFIPSSLSFFSNALRSFASDGSIMFQIVCLGSKKVPYSSMRRRYLDVFFCLLDAFADAADAFVEDLRLYDRFSAAVVFLYLSNASGTWNNSTTAAVLFNSSHPSIRNIERFCIR